MLKLKSITNHLIAAVLLSITMPAFSSAGETENPGTSSAESKLVSVSGYIKDAKTGESLIGATIYVRELKKALATNQYGFYSVSVLPGTYNLEFSYVGYQTIAKIMVLKDKTNVLNLELSDAAQQIGEVVVKSDKATDNIKRAEMSMTKLEMKTIKRIPALMGEVDVLKVIQMLPGVVPTSEGTSGFSVRGGGNDQNLIILDEATVYNASHLGGFFSVFNNDAIKDIKLYKGDIPAAYGGRLSSVLDVRQKDGNSKKISGSGGIGLISSRLTLEIPLSARLAKDVFTKGKLSVDTAGTTKGSLLIAGRRTYYDIVIFPFVEQLKNTQLYFYDFNAKFNYQITKNDRIYFSGYLGRDITGIKDTSSMGFGNKTGSFRWNHQYSPKLFSNVTAVVSNYDYQLSTTQGGSEMVWNSKLQDQGLKIDYSFYPNTDNEIKFGASSTYHDIDPCDAWIKKDNNVQYFPKSRNYEYEHGIYVSNQQKVLDKLTLKYGIRYSIFQNVGKSNYQKYDANHNFLSTEVIPWNKVYHTYTGWEPRFAINYEINDVSSIKSSYSRTYQYLQLASNSNGGMPLDYWFASSPTVKPQSSDQYAIGYFKNLFDNKIEFSVETFYKQMNNVIDFRDHAFLLFNDRLEGDVRSGKARSYGVELLVRKNEGKLTGWISYTYSRALRTIAGVNDGNEYPASYDKPHNLNIIANYSLSKRVSVSANWIYTTGNPITFPVGSFTIANNNVPIY